MMPTPNNVGRSCTHLGNDVRDFEKCTVVWAGVFVDLEVIALEGISFETDNASRCLFHNLVKLVAQPIVWVDHTHHASGHSRKTKPLPIVRFVEFEEAGDRCRESVAQQAELLQLV